MLLAFRIVALGIGPTLKGELMGDSHKLSRVRWAIRDILQLLQSDRPVPRSRVEKAVRCLNEANFADSSALLEAEFRPVFGGRRRTPELLSFVQGLFDSVDAAVSQRMKHEICSEGDGKTTTPDQPIDNAGLTTQAKQDDEAADESQTPKAQPVEAAGGLIDRLIAGPDDAELSPRDLALLEAYLQNERPTLADYQREAKAEGKSESAQRRNKLKLIRDFNRNLRAATPTANEAAPANAVAQPPDATAAESGGESVPESQSGYLGGAALADVLGVHPTQRDAFFQRLMRQRMSLGDECWHEVREPRPNSPRFLYRVDPPKLRDLATAYKTPKPA